MRLLYVEDNRINALLFEEMLQLDSRIELRVAENAADAVDLAGQWPPDVLVLDAHLPDATGFDLLPRLRALPGLLHVPAFMCSADTLPEDLQHATQAGFTGYWTKPVNVAAVLRDLASLEQDDAAPG